MRQEEAAVEEICRSHRERDEVDVVNLEGDSIGGFALGAFDEVGGEIDPDRASALQDFGEERGGVTRPTAEVDPEILCARARLPQQLPGRGLEDPRHHLEPSCRDLGVSECVAQSTPPHTGRPRGAAGKSTCIRPPLRRAECVALPSPRGLRSDLG